MSKIVAMAIAAATMLAGVAAARAEVSEPVDFTAKYVSGVKTKKNGGLTLRTVLRVSDSSGAKLPALTNTTLRFPKGAVVNAKYFKHCSPAKLESKGPSGCSKADRAGATKRATMR